MNVIPYMYHCNICDKLITDKLALGIRTDTNYYFHKTHSAYVYAEFIHGMNKIWKSTKEL